MARFGQALKPSKAPQQLSKASAPHNPPLALPSYLPIGPSNCFYWASKLLHGTFWPGLLLGSLSTAQPSACFATVSIGLRNCYMARFGQALKPSKAPQQLSKASAPHNPPLALPSYLPIGPSNCFYWASKLLHGTFWPGLKSLKSPAAAFESLSTAQPSACFAKTVSLGLRNCYMARFGQALKVICFPQFQNPPNRHHLPSHNPPLALPSHLPSEVQTVSIGL